MNISFAGKTLYKMPDLQTAETQSTKKTLESVRNYDINQHWVAFEKDNQAYMLHLSNDEKGPDLKNFLLKLADRCKSMGDLSSSEEINRSMKEVSVQAPKLAQEMSEGLEAKEWIA